MTGFSERLASISSAKRQLLQECLRNSRQIAEPLAIVGMACRFPGAPTLDAYWNVIQNGVSAISEAPPLRWDVDELYDPTGEQSGRTSTRWGGFVDDVEKFDPQFFGITPREAVRMDPQQRLLLEVAWEALEIAGLAPDRMAGTSTGVFVGIGGADYSRIPAQCDDHFQYIDARVGTGNALSIAANRLSYGMDLRGPSMAVDTACSSSTMAIHLAAGALRNHECNAALAGGVNLILSPETTIAFSKAQMLSADGTLRPFDAGANGYVRAEGCGLIVLKRLSDAVRDGDNILAVLRATAVNQDGRTSGITASNPRAQQAVIRAALKQASLSGDQVSYIEAHGTGTPLGDPIEMEALAKIFPGDRNSSPCCVTSVKANIGHTETVSGVAGIIKVVLMMRHGLIPGQLHLKELNPRISLDGTRLQIPHEPRPWKNGRSPRIAGVSSFGFGGANTHVILEEYSAADRPTPKSERPIHVLAMSAKSETALASLAGRYAKHLQASPDISAADFCHTVNRGRSHFRHRIALTASDRGQLQKQLAAVHEGAVPASVKQGSPRSGSQPVTAFLFTGQGSQFVGMARSLFETQPTFRQTLEECDAILRDELPQPLLTAIYPQGGRPSPLNETAFTQPALFALEYALARLWMSWGAEPELLLGHSVGEYAAACLAGVFDLEDGLRLIARRAALMQALPRNGSMAVVFASVDRVEQTIAVHEDAEGAVSIAACNGPENTVISGKAEVVRALADRFESQGVNVQKLNVSHPFHSPLMAPMLDEFERFAEGIEYRPPRIPIASNLTGELLDTEPMDASYWRRHIRGAVQFSQGMSCLAEQGVLAYLEIGPSSTLLGMGRRCLTDAADVLWLPSLRKNRDDWSVLSSSVASLYSAGAKIDWDGFDRDWKRRRLALPTYPFERKRLATISR